MISPDQVDLVYALVRLSELLKRFSADALSDQTDDDAWQRLADLLSESARQCRHQVPL